MCEQIRMEETTTLFDKELWGTIEDIVVGRGPFIGDRQRRLTSLPIKFGG
jgi:hypothetical protein